MAASMWRMNGLWRRMAGILVLCALLLSNEVMCQDATDAPTPAAGSDVTTAAAAAAADSDATDAPDVVTTPNAAVGGESATPAVTIHGLATILNILDNIQGGDASGAPVTIVASVEDNVAAVVPRIIRTVVPDVVCVGKEDIPDSNAVKAVLATNDCESTKRLIQANPANWCDKDNCNLKIFQDGNSALVASDDASLATLGEALKSEQLKDKLGVTKTETPSSGSAVFVGILVSGLLAALGITVGYLKCQRRSEPKGVKLAEEAHPADQENQGNTLVSVAPLNPPPETPEKPSVNGESPEEAKTQPPPPTNGHSTTKTADTEL